MEESENLESFCHGNIPNHSNKKKIMKYQGLGNKKQDFGMIWDMSYMLNFRAIPLS